GLNKTEVEKMVKDAEAHAAEDAKRREQVQTMNEADSIVFTAEKLLREHGDKLPEDAKKQTQEKIDAVNKAKSEENFDAVKTTSEALASYIQQLGAQMYQQPAAGAAPDAANGADGAGNKDKKDGEDVVGRVAGGGLVFYRGA
ncbi:MAG: Hsp70 family protein, partial [Anaerolineae bacterium]|nr:Hsp70 family protein [Anaerolineae bacterium]